MLKGHGQRGKGYLAIIVLVLFVAIPAMAGILSPTTDETEQMPYVVSQVPETQEAGVQESGVEAGVQEYSVEAGVQEYSVEAGVQEPGVEAGAQESGVEADTSETDVAAVSYKFRSAKLLNQHYEKHGVEMGFDSAAEYEEAASAVINNPEALYKTEKEDGDGVYYVSSTNEFVILSTDGYIRTYFYPGGGIDYFNRQ